MRRRICRKRVGVERLVSKLREAMTPPIVDALTRAVNAHLDDAEREHDERGGMLKAEILKLEREAGNPVRFLAAANRSQYERSFSRSRALSTGSAWSWPISSTAPA